MRFQRLVLLAPPSLSMLPHATIYFSQYVQPATQKMRQPYLCKISGLSVDVGYSVASIGMTLEFLLKIIEYR